MPSQNSTIDYAVTTAATYDLSLASNPLGFSPIVDEQFEKAAKSFEYNPRAYPKLKGILVRKVADFYGTTSDNVYIGGRGAVGVISSVFQAGLIKENQFLVAADATFPAAAVAAHNHGIGVMRFKLGSDFRVDFGILRNTVLDINLRGMGAAVFLCNPNNPTGIAESTKDIIDLARDLPQTLIFVSEANIEMVSDSAFKRIGGSLLDRENISKLPKNILVIRSFSKAYGLVDDRMGYAIGDPYVINALSGTDVPFAIGDRQIIRACLALQDQAHVKKSRSFMSNEIIRITAVLEELDFLNTTKSDSNLMLAGIPEYFSNSIELKEMLLEQGCSVVACGTEFGATAAGKYIRIAPNTDEHNNVFLKALKNICDKKKKDFYSTYGDLKNRKCS